MNKDEVKAVARTLAEANGLINISRRDLCDVLGISDSAWGRYFDFKFTELVDELAGEMGQAATSPATRGRVRPALRKAQILDVALELARDKPYNQIRRADIAEAAGISESLVTRCYGTMPQLLRDIMRAAIKREVLHVVAQGLACGDKHARKAPPELRARAANNLAELFS